MLQLDALRTRIEDQVPALVGNLGNAAQFTLLVDKGQLPQWRIGGFILPGGLIGGQVRSATAVFIQDVQETIAVVLVCRVASDPTGEKALDEITPLVVDVVMGVIGWAPEGVPGVFSLVKGELVGSQGNALIFQLDFALLDQLRKTA